MIIQGNARRIPLADKSIHCVVTSPPYWGLRDYGIPPTIWGGGAWLGCLGLEPTPELYVEHVVEVFSEVRRVLRDDGTLWLNLGDSYATGAGKVGECPGDGEQGARWCGDVDRLRDDKRGYRGERLANGRRDQSAVLRKKTIGFRGDHPHDPKRNGASIPIGPGTQPNRMPIAGLKAKDLIGIPWRVAFALQADGWYMRSDIIWAKPNAMPESVTDRPTKAHEYIFLLAKSERYYFDQEAVAEPVSENTHARLAQKVEAQIGSARANGGAKSNGNMKAVFNHKMAAAGEGIRNNDSFSNSVCLRVEKRNIRSVWEVATQPFSEAHFATFPEVLIKPCILAGAPAGGVVLDPFVGSGTVVKVAQDLGRIGIGCDLKMEYLQMAKRRSAQQGFGALLAKAGAS